MRTIKHFILTDDDVKALEKASRILNEMFGRDRLLTAGDIQNIANVAEGLDPVYTEYGNFMTSEWTDLKDSVTKATD